MSGLAWVIVAILVMIGGLAFAAFLMNLPILLILAGSAFALLIVFLLVTRGPRPIAPAAEPAASAVPAAQPTPPPGETSSGPVEPT